MHPLRLRLAALFLSCLVPLSVRGDDAHYTGDVTVRTILQTTRTATGQAIQYPSGTPEVTVLYVEIPPGGQTGWHIHPVPCYGYILSGTLTVELADGTSNTYAPGDALVETVDTRHRGVNRGAEPVRLVFFANGEEGEKYVIPVAPPGE